jgi:hypothetical protein
MHLTCFELRGRNRHAGCFIALGLNSDHSRHEISQFIQQGDGRAGLFDQHLIKHHAADVSRPMNLGKEDMVRGGLTQKGTELPSGIDGHYCPQSCR